MALLEFTGKERDQESGLDYFGARYYGSALGRFTSPDSTGYSGLTNPQSWNLSYTFNNPLRYVDPTGHTVECKTDAKACLAAAKGAVGAKAAAQLGTKTTQTRWQMVGGHNAVRDPAANGRDAVNSENEVRRTDPSRGQKTAHHD